jgi:hypothetical protein
MASILKVDTIQDQSGNNIINENADTITIGASGDTITVPTGATLTVPSGGLSGQNYPAFEAYLSVTQSIPNATATKIQFATEVYDTDNAYDNSTNYRFTPQVSGKYFVYSFVRFLDVVNEKQGIIYVYKNGSPIAFVNNTSSGNTGGNITTTMTKIVNLNGSTDYIEIFGFQDSGTTKSVQGLSGTSALTLFGAYRIGD